MPDLWMDVDAAVTVPVNKMPLVDRTDGYTLEDAVVYNEAGLFIVWNFVTTAGVMTTTDFTPTTAGVHDWLESGTNRGMYKVEIPASAGTVNNDTEGFGWISGESTTTLPFCGLTIGFRAAALNNALIDGGDNLDVNTAFVSGTAQTANDNGADINTLISRVTAAVALASVCTEGRLAELDAANLPTDAGRLTAARAQAIDDWINGGRLDLILDIIAADTTTDIPAKLLKYIQLLARSDAAIETDNATELTAINANGGSGAGNFSAQMDAVEAIRDHVGDGTNLTEAGGDGDHLTAINLSNQTMDIIGNITGNLSGSVGSLTGHTNQTADHTANISTLLTRLSAARAGYLDELNVATSGKMAWYQKKAFIALVNKAKFKESDGEVEQFNDAGGSLGTIATAVTSDSVHTTRKRMVI